VIVAVIVAVIVVVPVMVAALVNGNDTRGRDPRRERVRKVRMGT
jgi:hypothetical protein